jgi:hypothetical protein
MSLMLRRLPWLLTLPTALAGSWMAHVLGRAMTVGPLEGPEATEHLERATITHGGQAALGVAASLAPFAAVACIMLAARLWSKSRGRSWRGAGPGWFLILPALAYVMGELLERVTSEGGEALTLHSFREPRLLLALALQIPFGAVAYAIARLLFATARAIFARVRSSVQDPARRPDEIEPVTWIARARWSCLVGARGLRGPPVLLPS